MNITKSAVDSIPIPAKTTPGQTAQKRYYDDQLKGFGIRATSGGSKTFFIEKLVKGKLRRIKIMESLPFNRHEKKLKFY